MVTRGDTEKRTARVPDWFRQLDDEQRLQQVNFTLTGFYVELGGKLLNFHGNVEVLTVSATGQITVKLDGDLHAAERGVLLRCVENHLCGTLCDGLEVWVEPQPDKNRLRALRGVTVKASGD